MQAAAGEHQRQQVVVPAKPFLVTPADKGKKMNGIKKFLVIEVEGESVMKFPIVSPPDGRTFEAVEAILASNPVLRFVDEVEVGQHWNGSKYGD